MNFSIHSKKLKPILEEMSESTFERWEKKEGNFFSIHKIDALVPIRIGKEVRYLPINLSY